MYYHNFPTSLTVDELSQFLADRVTTEDKVLVVSKNPEELITDFKLAWKKQTSQLAAERDHLVDISYMATLTEIITIMQQTTIDYSEANHVCEIAFAHPYDINPQIWTDRQVVVCWDQLSAETYVHLLKVASTDFQLIATVAANDLVKKQLKQLKAQPISYAEKELRSLLSQQKSIVEDLGLEIDQLIDLDSVGRLKRLAADLTSDDIYLIGKFRHNQRRIAELRLICGRASTFRGLSQNNLDNLKQITRYFLDSDSYNSDNQLYDDPYDLKWQKIAGKP